MKSWLKVVALVLVLALAGAFAGCSKPAEKAPEKPK